MNENNRVIVTHRNESHYTIVAIKKHQLKIDQLVKRLISCNYTNIVNLLKIFYDNDFVHMTYEWTNVTLIKI